MDSAVVRQKLASIERCVRRIEACQPRLEKSIDEDPDAHDSVALNLVRAIGLSADVALHLISGWGAETPASMATSFEPLVAHRVLTREMADELRRAVGFRNVVVHNYEAVNWAFVLPVLDARLALFKTFVESILKYMAADAAPAPQ
jgi:uncharacterized protein YutE (UPF0331/DUF86 family)